MWWTRKQQREIEISCERKSDKKYYVIAGGGGSGDDDSSWNNDTLYVEERQTWVFIYIDEERWFAIRGVEKFHHASNNGIKYLLRLNIDQHTIQYDKMLCHESFV